MGEYFEVLKRLEADRQFPGRITPRPIGVARPAVRSFPGTGARSRATVKTQWQDNGRPGVYELTDTLRSMNEERCAPTVVFAGADGNENVGSLLAFLGKHTRTRGLRLRSVAVAHDRTANEADALKVDVYRPQWETVVREWLAAAPAADLTIFHGPALHGCADAAYLAGVCGGLVIVAELGITSRSGLSAAVQRARSANCTILGLVVLGSEGQPKWARRILDHLTTSNGV